MSHEQVVGHRPRRRRALQLHQDRGGLGVADPDRQELVAVDGLEQHDRLLADHVEAHAVDDHFLHRRLPRASRWSFEYRHGDGSRRTLSGARWWHGSARDGHMRVDATRTQDPDLPRPRRPRRAHVRRRGLGARRRAARLDDHRRPDEPARRAAGAGAGRARSVRADDRRRPEPGLPAHRGPRGLDHRFLGAPARALARSRRDHARALRSARRARPQLSAPAHGRLGLRGRPALHLRRRPRRANRLPPRALLDRPRPRRDPAPAAPGAAAESGSEGDGHPVEPAGVDEDQRLTGRRALQGRPARL